MSSDMPGKCHICGNNRQAHVGDGGTIEYLPNCPCEGRGLDIEMSETLQLKRIVDYVRSAYRLGINPLPALRKQGRFAGYCHSRQAAGLLADNSGFEIIRINDPKGAWAVVELYS